MVIAKSCLVVVALIAFATLFTVASAEVTRDGDKLMVRTKRQQCVCVVVSTANNQLQCSCDNTDQSTTSPGSPSGPYVSVPSTSATFAPIPQTVGTPAPYTTQSTGTTPVFADSSTNPCTCVQIVISQSSNSQYSCSCDAANPTALDQGSSQNFLSSALNQADYIGNSVTGQNSQYAPTAATPVPSMQQQQQPQQQQQQYQPPQQYAPQNNNYLSNALDQSNYLNAGSYNTPNTASNNNNNMNYQSQSPSTSVPSTQYGTQNQQPSTASTPQPQQYDSQYDAEPATTTCITITIPNNGAQTSVQLSPSSSCMCGQNYVQCADNMCCHKRYRSMKKEEDSAMDIIVDVLRNIKERLDHRA